MGSIGVVAGRMAARQRSYLHRGAAAVALALLGLVLGAVIALQAWPGPIVAWGVANVLSNYVGRQIIVEGPVEVEWGAPARLVLHDLVVANEPWGRAPELLRVPVAKVAVFPWTLLRRPVHFQSVEFDGATLSLERAANGAHNWPSPRHPIPFIERLLINDGAISYRNDATKRTLAVDARAWRLDAAARDAPAKISLASRIGGKPVTLAGTIGALAALRESQAPYPIDVAASLAGETLSASGSVAHPLQGQGVDLRLGAGGRAVAALAAALSLKLPPLPDFRATAELKGSRGGPWDFAGLRASLGASDVAGDLAYGRVAGRPSLRANLHAANLDLADFEPYLPAPKPAPPSQSDVIPDWPLRADALGRFDAKIAIAADRLALAQGVVLQQADLAGSFGRGVLRVDRLRFALAGGSFDGALAIDGNASPARARLDLTIRQLDLARLMAALGLSDKLKGIAGTAGGFAHVSGSGDTLREAMAGMNGQVAVYADDGMLPAAMAQLAAYNLLTALNLAPQQPVPVRCLVGGFDIADGVATSRTAVLDTPEALSVGSGNFNFRGETMTFDITPLVPQGGGLDYYAPVTVRGTFANPKLGVAAGSIPQRLAASALSAFLPGDGTDSGRACERALAAAVQEQSASAAPH